MTKSMNAGKTIEVNGEILSTLNTELRKFLEHSLTTESFWEKWSSVRLPFRDVKCWEINNCKRERCPAFKHADCRCWLTVGTLCGGEVQGDFAKKYPSCFQCEVMSRIEEDILRALFEDINILIHHLRKRDERILKAAITDRLTGVYNRSYFNEYIDKRLAEAGRYEEQMSFIMVDLDGFKYLNDTHGHLAGDDLLVQTAALLTGVVRKSDLVFRYGGDEFLVVLPLADCDQVGPLKMRIAEAAEQWNRQNKRYPGFTLKLSTGCSTWKHGDDLILKLNQADAMMYREKKKRKMAS